MWYNIGNCHEPQCINIKQKLEITSEKWKDWSIYAMVSPDFR
jgi:hypothetical protein